MVVSAAAPAARWPGGVCAWAQRHSPASTHTRARENAAHGPEAAGTFYCFKKVPPREQKAQVFSRFRVFWVRDPVT